MISGELRVAHHPLPEDRVGDAEVRADQDDAVRLLEVLIGVRRGVEPERLLVGHDRRRHALAGVAVAVDHPHAELGQRARAGPSPRWRSGRCSGRRPSRRRAPPGSHRNRAVIVVSAVCQSTGRRRPSVAAQQRHGRAVGGVEHGQGFPALGAGHAAVDRVVGRRREVDRLAVAEMDGQAAAGRAEAADHPRGRVGRLAGGNLPQPEPARARAAARGSAGRRVRGRATRVRPSNESGCRRRSSRHQPSRHLRPDHRGEEQVPLERSRRRSRRPAPEPPPPPPPRDRPWPPPRRPAPAGPRPPRTPRSRRRSGRPLQGPAEQQGRPPQAAQLRAGEPADESLASNHSLADDRERSGPRRRPRPRTPTAIGQAAVRPRRSKRPALARAVGQPQHERSSRELDPADGRSPERPPHDVVDHHRASHARRARSRRPTPSKAGPQPRRRREPARREHLEPRRRPSPAWRRARTRAPRG